LLFKQNPETLISEKALLCFPTGKKAGTLRPGVQFSGITGKTQLRQKRTSKFYHAAPEQNNEEKRKRTAEKRIPIFMPGPGVSASTNKRNGHQKTKKTAQGSGTP